MVHRAYRIQNGFEREIIQNPKQKANNNKKIALKFGICTEVDIACVDHYQTILSETEMKQSNLYFIDYLVRTTKTTTEKSFWMRVYRLVFVSKMA